jgi:hypothetical protein
MNDHRQIIYKEIKRGGIHCTIEKETDAKLFVRLKYKDQIREFGPYQDEDEASMFLGDKAEAWVQEILSFAKNKNLRG